MKTKRLFSIDSTSLFLVWLILMGAMGCDDAPSKAPSSPRKTTVTDTATNTSTQGGGTVELPPKTSGPPTAPVTFGDKFDGIYRVDFFLSGATTPLDVFGVKEFKVKNGLISVAIQSTSQSVATITETGELLANGSFSVSSNVQQSLVQFQGSIKEQQNGRLIDGEFIIKDSQGNITKQGSMNGLRLPAAVVSSQLSPAGSTATTTTNNTATNLDGLFATFSPEKNGTSLSMHVSPHFGVRIKVPIQQNNSQDAIEIVSYNAGLSKGYVPYKEERKIEIIKNLKKLNADVVCLQEVWDSKDVDDIVRATDSRFGFSYSTTEDQKNVTNLPACEESMLKDSGFSTCTDRLCDEKLKALALKGSKEKICAAALMAQVGSTRKEAIAKVTSKTSKPGLFAYEGSTGLLILSKSELRDTDSLNLDADSTAFRRSVLYARINDKQNHKHHVFCTQLSENIERLPYTGKHDSWGDEQSTQIDRLLDFVSEKAGTEPQYIAGPFDCDSATAQDDGNFFQNCRKITFSQQFEDLVNDKLGCTFCSNNLLVQKYTPPVTPSVHPLDRIFTKFTIGDPEEVEDDIKVEQVFTEIRTIHVGTADRTGLFDDIDDAEDQDIDSNYSNHFGTALRFSLNTTNQIPVALSLGTFNTGLSTGLVDYSLERRPRVINALNSQNADVLCLQEVWAEEDAKIILKALKSVYPFGYYEVAQPKKTTSAPCDASNTKFKDFRSCIQSQCGQKRFREFSACLVQKCKTQAIALPNQCTQSILAQVGNSPEDILTGATQTNADLLAYGGSNGLLLLSKRELTQKSVRELESSFIRRSVLYGQVLVDGKSQHLFCGQLTTDPLKNPLDLSAAAVGWIYTGSSTEADPWRAENAKQADGWLQFAKEKAEGQPQFLMGSFQCGLAKSAEDITAFYPESCEKFTNTGGYNDFFAAQRTPLCTFCQRNELNPGNNLKKGLILDHIFTRNLNILDSSSNLTFDQLIVIQQGIVDPILGIDTQSTDFNSVSQNQTVTKFDGTYELSLMRSDGTVTKVDTEIISGNFNALIQSSLVPQGVNVVGNVFENGSLFFRNIQSNLPITASGEIDLVGTISGTYFLGGTENSFFGFRKQAGSTTVTPGSSDGIAYVLCAKTIITADDPLYCRPEANGCVKRTVLGFSLYDDERLNASGEKNTTSFFNGQNRCVAACNALALKKDPRTGLVGQVTGIGKEFGKCESAQ